MTRRDVDVQDAILAYRAQYEFTKRHNYYYVERNKYSQDPILFHSIEYEPIERSIETQKHAVWMLICSKFQ